MLTVSCTHNQSVPAVVAVVAVVAVAVEASVVGVVVVVAAERVSPFFTLAPKNLMSYLLVEIVPLEPAMVGSPMKVPTASPA